jgi:hypothetical protein
MFFPPALVIAYLFTWSYIKKRSNRKFPFADAVLRNPGDSLAEKMRDLSMDMGLYFPLTALIPLYFYAVYLQMEADRQQAATWFVPIVLGGFGLLAALWFLFKYMRALKELHRYRIGYAGEVAVGNALNQLMLQGYRVFHDIQGDKKFNIDHLLVGPTGVFAVETKTKTKMKKIEGRQAFKVIYDGKSLYFPDRPNTPHRAFLEQSKRNAKWVSNWLSEATGHPVKVQPVLVLPGWYIDVKKPGSVRVLNHKQVQAMTTVSNEKPLDKPEIVRNVHQIQQRCQNRNLVPGVFREE